MSTWSSTGYAFEGDGSTWTETFAKEGESHFLRIRELDSNEWGLVWADEFNGDQVNYSDWSHLQNGEGGGNNELQYYTIAPANTTVSDGSLKIKAIRESYTDIRGNGYDWTSGRIRTYRQVSFKYGRIEVRAKFPAGQGFWPAIWLLPRDSVYGTWAASGEIDIVENRGQEPNQISGTIHYGGQWPNNTFSGRDYVFSSGNVNDEFHTYAIEWEAGEIRWYVNGERYSTQTEWSSEGGAFPAPFDQEFFLIINLAVGGWFPGNPDGSTPPEGTLEVDWVRYYKKAP